MSRSSSLKQNGRTKAQPSQWIRVLLLLSHIGVDTGADSRDFSHQYYILKWRILDRIRGAWCKRRLQTLKAIAC